MKKSYDYLLFDLDGTLTDSARGIMNGFAYAIEKLGGQAVDKSVLRTFIGPPLRVSFGETLGYSPEDVRRAVVFYREYYDEQGGAFENSVYPGVEQLLGELKESGKKLLLATSKSIRAASAVLEHFDLMKYFDVVATAHDQLRLCKADVIRYAFEQAGVANPARAIMIGDRDNDIIAAKEVGIDSVGVLYGYGDKSELETAGATYLAEDVDALRALLM